MPLSTTTNSVWPGALALERKNSAKAEVPIGAELGVPVIVNGEGIGPTIWVGQSPKDVFVMIADKEYGSSTAIPRAMFQSSPSKPEAAVEASEAALS